MTKNPCHHYIFFDLRQSWRMLTPDAQKRAKAEFKKVLSKSPLTVYCYATLGLRSETTFMLWINAPEPEAMQEFLGEIMKSELGTHLIVTYTLFGMVRDSVYVKKHTSKSQAIDTKKREPYLIVYPFTKTTEWYLLSFEERKKIMHDHIKVGYTHAHVKQLLLYAFGIDDHEFIVSYEMKKLEDFQSLVMDLRSTTARLYTKNDLPIFTCVYKTLPALLEVL